MSLHEIFRAAALVPLLVACSSNSDAENADVEDGEGASSSHVTPEGEREVQCDQRYMFMADEDAHLSEVKTVVTLLPNSVAQLHLSGPGMSILVTSKDAPDAHFDSQGQSLSYLTIGNTSATPKTYRVTMKKSPGVAAHSYYISCYPIAKAGGLSGVEDHAYCVAGARCTKTAAGGPAASTCSGASNVNLAAESGEPLLGHCY